MLEAVLKGHETTFSGANYTNLHETTFGISQLKNLYFYISLIINLK